MYDMNQIRRWHDLVMQTGVAGNPNVSFYRPQRWAPNPGPYQNTFPTGPSDKPMLQPMPQMPRIPTGPSDKPLWQQYPRRPAGGFQRPSLTPYYPLRPRLVPAPGFNRPMVIPPNIPVPSNKYNPWAGGRPLTPINVIR